MTTSESIIINLIEGFFLATLLCVIALWIIPHKRVELVVLVIACTVAGLVLSFLPIP